MKVERDSQGNAPGWLVWAALVTVYIVWGSTYLAIRVTVETLPPLLAMGARFILAGLVMYTILLIKRGREGVRVTPRQLVSCVILGTCFFLFANGMVAIAELELPSSLAALIIASVPLWLVAMRTVTGEKTDLGSLVGLAVGFSGVAILVMPGNRPAGVPTWAVVLIVLASFSWALGSLLSTRLSVPKDLLVSSAYQMIGGGLVLVIGGLLRGEASSFNASSWSGASLLGFFYLMTMGSLVGFTAFAWLLQNAPITKVSTYAYVNPVVAIFLGWAVVAEEVTATTLLGAAIIVVSVAFIVRKESKPAPEPEASAAARVVVPQEG